MHIIMHEIRPLHLRRSSSSFRGPGGLPIGSPEKLRPSIAGSSPDLVPGDILLDASSRGPASISPERNAYLLEAAERLSAALLNVVHQPTVKRRDRSLAALVALIYGPTPFGGVNSLRDVATRYGMTEQNLFQLMRGHRELLARAPGPEYEI